MSEPTLFSYETVALDDERAELVLLDQTRLPGEVIYLRLTEIEDIWQAIYRLQVRGAPAIGVAAGFGLYLAAKKIESTCYDDFLAQVKRAAAYLDAARPTAVNLSWALRRMVRAVETHPDETVPQLKARLYAQCLAIQAEDIETCRRIGEYGLTLLRDGDGILTHCNAGQLATSKYGTALAPIHLGAARGMRFHVFTDETRPLLQGARLSAFELVAGGVETTVICDNMASQVMKNGWVQAVVVGCDRVAANGDVCNKIGTSGVAILAKHYGIPFYVLGPTSTIDCAVATGAGIPIEERPPEEVTELWYKKRMAPEGVGVYNPAFDVTDHALVTALITEYGVIRPPFDAGIRAVFEQKRRENPEEAR